MLTIVINSRRQPLYLPDTSYLCILDMSQQHPKIAVIDPNTLSAIGLKMVLENLVPHIAIDVYGCVSELNPETADDYYHYFVALTAMLGHRQFFAQRKRKTIVMTPSADSEAQVSDFTTLPVFLKEQELVKQMLAMLRRGHPAGRNLPPETVAERPKVLSPREVQVMTLIVKGLLNKEIADRLSISLNTVVTHRKNIMQKLNAKSVAALTIYAVMNGYVDVGNG